ncbi:MAG: PilZ domain-containing protein [Lachnospiraceae bacterium]|nr:PilZ domain-containing protein [Lachnospiraceae bacterium]
MGLKLSDLEERDALTIIASTDMGEMKLQGFVKKVLKENVAIIEIIFQDGRTLNFENVQLNIEYAPEDGVPFIWRAARIVNVKGQYVLQVAGEGVRHNRRSCFRVSVGVYARMAMIGRQGTDVMIRDVSLSGFSIADRDKNLELELGDELTVVFSDMGYNLKLIGRVVRLEEMEHMIIYGMETRNLCKDLSTYISMKQQKNRRSKDK